MADEEFMFGDLFATVRVQDLPAAREVVAVERQENGTWRVCGSAIANTDGIAELGIEGSKTSRVYAFAIDHWGEPFTPNRTVAYGDIIRPSVFLGWLYRVTAPGVLPGEEPVWWNSTPGMPRPVGSAMAQAEMYFQPIAHGPVDIEWEEKGVGDPHWDKVVSLLHFDDPNDAVKTEKGATWYIHEVNSGFGEVTQNAAKFGVAGLKLNSPRGANYYFPATDGVILSGEIFTAEVFCMPKKQTSYIFATLLVEGDSDQILYFNDNGNIRFHRAAGAPGGYLVRDGVNQYTLNTYYHIAMTFDGTHIRVFVDGNKEIEIATASGWVGYSSTRFCLGDTDIGSYNSSYRQATDTYLDELRITKGVARYTENFTPPTEPFPNFK